MTVEEYKAKTHLLVWAIKKIADAYDDDKLDGLHIAFALTIADLFDDGESE